MIATAEQKRKDYPIAWQREKASRESRHIPQNPLINALLYVTARRHGLSLSQLVNGGNRKYATLVRAREVLVYLLRQKLLLSQPQVAGQMGYDAPSSVLLAERRVTTDHMVEAAEIWAEASRMCGVSDNGLQQPA